MEKAEIKCPSCGKRLFDLTQGPAVGTVTVKCPRCKATYSIDLASAERAAQEKSE